ncbi:MAG: DUF1569 domain-containing protein [bacterium]
MGWQIDHSLKVINGVIGMLKNAPTNKQPKVTLMGRICMLFRYIPRGRGKAPDRVLPPDIITKEALEKQLSLAKQNITMISNMDSRSTFEHLYFGILSKKQTIRFLETHTKHHLKIIRDILK